MINENRLEKKFVYNQGDETFRLFIINGMFKETYSPRVVNSIYFDTPVFHDVWDNINGFGNRKKIRIRWYDKINKSNVFIEEKKKLNSVTQKTVKSLGVFKDYAELCDFINNENFFKQDFILKKKLNIKRTIFIQYMRNYYELPNQKLRLTVDRNLKIFNNYPSKFIDLNKTILELKYKVNQSSYVNNFIYNNKLDNRNKKFSKYINSFIELNDSALI
jgi:SPX domain protein involved in polyphosphate accumulation|tara:strand:- start:783 stop:1436 length:654 start_codon:yes stop_codon:yes gene_type:complete